MSLIGKKVLVTGAARCIGRRCAFELARAGADVVVNDRNRSPEAEAVVAEIRALGRRPELVEGDAFHHASCEHETFGDAVIHAAGPTLPWGRMGMTEVIGKAAGFLASDAGDYVAGAVLTVDGGLLLRDALEEYIGSRTPTSASSASVHPAPDPS